MTYSFFVKYVTGVPRILINLEYLMIHVPFARALPSQLFQYWPKCFTVCRYEFSLQVYLKSYLSPTLYCYFPIVPLVDKFNNGPNVFPLSVLIFITGVLAVWFVSPHVATTLLASDSIPTLVESALGVLLKLILSLNVCPLLVDALKNASFFPVLLSYNVT